MRNQSQDWILTLSNTTITITITHMQKVQQQVLWWSTINMVQQSSSKIDLINTEKYLFQTSVICVLFQSKKYQLSESAMLEANFSWFMRVFFFFIRLFWFYWGLHYLVFHLGSWVNWDHFCICFWGLAILFRSCLLGFRSYFAFLLSFKELKSSFVKTKA